MFLSWKGRGWMVGATTAGCLLATDYLTGAYFHDQDYYAHHGWPKLAAFWTSAAIVKALVPRGEEVLAGAIDVSPQKAVLREEDGLFFIPIKFWPLVLIGAGIAFYFVSG
jgi:hypothetical protein